jgi:hypothetical protein
MTQAAFNFARDGRRAVQPGKPAATRDPAAAGRFVESGEADPVEAIGFDHARYGLVPPSPFLWPGHPVREGWERGRRLLGRRAREATPAVRRWLGLRLAAWQRGEAFDDHQITPQVLRSLEAAERCPVSGRPLGDDARVVPADTARGWVAGNLVLLDPAIAERWQRLGWDEARAALARAEAAPESPIDGLTLREWRRLATLKSLATPLPHEEAARVPMHALPPNRLRLVNPIQELQALLTMHLAVPGWGQRARLIADTLPLPLRTEFNLFFNSLLAQALRQGQGATQSPMREALATAWGDAVVQRRWDRFARGVDADLARTLVERLAREPMPGVRVVRHGPEGVDVAANAGQPAAA